MKDTYVNQLLTTQQTISNVPLLITKIEKKPTKSGGEFYDLSLTDRTGSISAKIWSDKFNACSVDILEEGKVVLTSGEAKLYMGKNQLSLSMLIITEDYNEEDFVSVSKKDIEQMFTELQKYIANIKDKNIRILLNNIFTDQKFTKVYKQTAAAKSNHHNFLGGLLEHSLELVKFSEAMLDKYQCNRDIVIAGAILHDIGKVEELEWKNMVINYTVKGRLLGHMELGIQLVAKYLPKDFDLECILQIQHIILSHHGKLEYGSPILPATIEAKIVSLADDVSAKLRMYQDAFDNHETRSDNNLVEYVKSIETSVYYKKYVSVEEDLENPDTVPTEQMPLI